MGVNYPKLRDLLLGLSTPGGDLHFLKANCAPLREELDSLLTAAATLERVERERDEALEYAHNVETGEELAKQIARAEAQVEVLTKDRDLFRSALKERTWQYRALRKALEPFAKIAPSVEHTDLRDGDVVHRQRTPTGYAELTKDDFRRVVAALASSTPESSVEAACFECGAELHAPFCPACNPEMVSGGWRPIETAPKDGSDLLLICASAYTPEASVGWWADASGGPGWYNYSRPENKWHGGVNLWFPTHWMSLPAAPAEGGK